MQGGCRQSAGLWLTMASVPSPALCVKLVTCRYPSIANLLDIYKHKFGLTDQEPITKLENLDVDFLARFRGLFFS